MDFKRYKILDYKNEKTHVYLLLRCSKCNDESWKRSDMGASGRYEGCEGCRRADMIEKEKAQLGVIIQNFKVVDYDYDVMIKDRRSSYLAKCLVCGHERWVALKQLKAKRTAFCNCNNKRHIKDLVGQKFGQLTVVSLIEKPDQKRKTFWLCECSCGETTEARGDSLQAGAIQSCGCMHDELFRKNSAKTKVENTHLGAIRSTKLSTRNTSGVKGVAQVASGRWGAQITFQGKKHSLGTFATREEAAVARKRAEEKYFKPILEKYKDRLPESKKDK